MNDLSLRTSAVLSDCGHYRYVLTRRWNDSLPDLCWIMLNPSVADAEQDDPTICRCVRFARAWGYGGISVVNLFAYRATCPNALHDVEDPVGPDNDDWIRRTVCQSRLSVAAWGVGGTYLDREQKVLELLRVGPELHCLGLTKYQRPRHPLYVRGDVGPVPFSG